MTGQQGISEVQARQMKSNNDAASLQIRMDTEKVKNRISDLLKGIVRVYKVDTEKQVLQEEEVVKGKVRCNDIGYQAIMTLIEACVNVQVVQGNFEDHDSVMQFISDFHKVFVMDLWINRRKYGLEITEFRGLISKIFVLIIPFMTRTIGDKERATIRETVSQTDRIVNQNTGRSAKASNFFA